GLAALERGLGRLLGRLGLAQRGVRLLDGDGVALALDRDQHVARLDHLALDEPDLVDRAGDPRGDLDLLERVERARRGDRVLHLARRERGDVARVLQLEAALGGGSVAGLRAAGADGRHRHDRDRDPGLHGSGSPSGSSPIAWRSARYALATENCASAKLTSAAN